MPNMSSQAVLSALALIILGVLAMALVYVAVPPANRDLLYVIVGGLTTAITVTGASKLADKITNSKGPNATIQADGPEGQA